MKRGEKRALFAMALALTVLTALLPGSVPPADASTPGSVQALTASLDPRSGPGADIG